MQPEEFINEELDTHCYQPDENDWGGKPSIEDVFHVAVDDKQYAVASDGHHLIAVRESPSAHPPSSNAAKVAEWLTASQLGWRTMLLRDLRLWCLETPLSTERRHSRAFGHVFNRQLIARAIEPGAHEAEVTAALVKDADHDKHMLRITACDGSWIGIVMQMAPGTRAYGADLESAR